MTSFQSKAWCPCFWLVEPGSTLVPRNCIKLLTCCAANSLLNNHPRRGRLTVHSHRWKDNFGVFGRFLQAFKLNQGTDQLSLSALLWCSLTQGNTTFYPSALSTDVHIYTRTSQWSLGPGVHNNRHMYLLPNLQVTAVEASSESVEKAWFLTHLPFTFFQEQVCPKVWVARKNDTLFLYLLIYSDVYFMCRVKLGSGPVWARQGLQKL